jgi:DNA-directed RNA polymerase subunit N (RpoN/RPB10)
MKACCNPNTCPALLPVPRIRGWVDPRNLPAYHVKIKCTTLVDNLILVFHFASNNDRHTEWTTENIYVYASNRRVLGCCGERADKTYRRFEGVRSLETSVIVLKSTRRNILEDLSLHHYCCDNLETDNGGWRERWTIVITTERLNVILQVIWLVRLKVRDLNWKKLVILLD